MPPLVGRSVVNCGGPSLIHTLGSASRAEGSAAQLLLIEGKFATHVTQACAASSCLHRSEKRMIAMTPRADIYTVSPEIFNAWYAFSMRSEERRVGKV